MELPLYCCFAEDLDVERLLFGALGTWESAELCIAGGAANSPFDPADISRILVAFDRGVSSRTYSLLQSGDPAPWKAPWRFTARCEFKLPRRFYRRNPCGAAVLFRTPHEVFSGEIPAGTSTVLELKPWHVRMGEQGLP